MLDNHFKKEEFKKSVKENVKMLYRKTIEEATQEQIFQAVSLAVKDVIIDNWLLTQKQYEKDDPKIVYYLSMEFLMGRALGNNLINLCAYNEVKEALDELGFDLNVIEDQEPDPALSGFLPFFIKIQKLIVHSLSFSDIKDIEKLRQRLRIVRAGAASDHNRILLCTIRCMERDMAQIQDLKNIGITHLKLNGNAQEIKLSDRILGFQRKKRDVLIPHYLIKVMPRRIHPFAPYVFPAVEHVIQDLDSEMGHPDFIDVRKAHTEADVHLFFVFHHRVHLIPNVPGRLLDI